MWKTPFRKSGHIIYVRTGIELDVSLKKMLHALFLQPQYGTYVTVFVKRDLPHTSNSMNLIGRPQFGVQVTYHVSLKFSPRNFLHPFSYMLVLTADQFLDITLFQSEGMDCQSW